MRKRTRLVLLSALFLCLVPVVFFVYRDTTLTDAQLAKRAAREDREFLQANMPGVVVPGYKQPPTERHKKDYRFRHDWFTHHIAVWDKVFAEHKGRPDVRYLEVGLHEGMSFFWMLDNVLTHPTSNATGLDLFHDDPSFKPGEQPRDLFYANLKLSGQEDRVKLLIGYSQVELRKLPVDAFDIIYIDGSHAAADVLEDAVLAHRLLKANGLLIFDDYRWGFEGPVRLRPKPAVDMFYAFFRDQYDVVHNEYQLILRKKPASSAPAPAPAPAPSSAPAVAMP